MKGTVRILSIILIIAAVVMSGCNRKIATVRPVVLHDSVTTDVNSINISEDKPGISDSASILALLKCDSLGNIYLKAITQLQGEVVSQALFLENNVLKVEASSKTREKKEVTLKDSVRTITVEKAVPYPVEKVTNRLTSWQSFQIWTGRIVLIALAGFLIIKFAGSKLSFITKLFK